MAKRSLCMLLALATLFSLAVPAFAEEAPAEEPVVTEEPVVEAAEEPAVEVTEVPVVEATEVPVEATEVPVETTEVPVETTEVPVETTEVPVEATEVPVEVTEVPAEATEVPVEATEEPVVTEEPEVTEGPEEPETVAPEDEIMPAADAAASGTCGDGVQWSFSGTTLTISGSGSMDDYNSKNDYLGPLTTAPWRDIAKQITSVDIQNGVTGIGKSAFVGCRSLTSVTIPASVTMIGDHAFAVTALTSVTIPAGVTRIGEDAFALTALTNVNISSGETTIGRNAFYSCESLTSVTVPNDLTNIEPYAFSGTPWLKAKGDFGIVNGILLDYQGTATSVTIPASVTTIGAFAFSGSGVTSVTISEGTTSIGDQAFDGLESLTSVTIPGSVVSIGESAFDDCKALAEVSIGNGVKTIESHAFSYCTSLTDVTIPGSVVSIGEGAFICDGLISLIVPDSVTTVGQQAFGGCDALVKASIGSGVTTIGYGAFGDWRELKELTINFNAETVSHAFDGMGENSGSVAVTFGPEVTRIPSQIFSNWDDETELDYALTSVVIPNSVTCIGSHAFDGCAGLTSLNLPSSVVTIENSAFEGCAGLTELTIPDSVKTLEDGAFEGCASLSSLVINGNLTDVSSIVIDKGGTTVSHGRQPFLGCGESSGSFEVTFGGNVTRIPGSLFSYCDNLTSVTISDSVTSIGAMAFEYCTGLTSIKLPKVTSIGVWAFRGCTSLTSINLPKVTSIEEWAFRGCTSLKNVTFSNCLKEIGNNAFSGCTSLTKVTIPGSVKSFGVDVGGGAYTFSGCTGLTSVTLSEGIENLPPEVFSDCTSLTSVSVPASVTEIGPCVFDGCKALTKITVLNPNCMIAWMAADAEIKSETIPAKTTIYGYDDSTAEKYAKEYGNPFKSLGKAPSMPFATPKPDATPAPAKLAAPKITKMENTADGLKVTWGKVDGADRYMVFYKLKGASKWTKIGTTTATSYTRKNANLTSGKTYVFTIRCVKNDKKTYTSDYDKAGKSLTYYAAPTVKIAKASNGGIKVTWNKISGVSRYMVYYRENGGSWKKIGTTTSTTYTRKAANLKNGVTYEFTVRCVKNDKKTMLSSYKASNSLKYTAAGTTQLAAPTVKISKVSAGIKVTWNKISGAPRYMVYYRENGGSWKKIGTTTATSYTRKAANLKNGVTYEFTVRCVKNDKTTFLSGYKASNSLKYKK